MIQASCECGKVRFQFPTARKEITVCHCSQCRKTSGHLWAATRTDFDSLHFEAQDTLTWYQSSPAARRGFCAACGSSLFYQINGESGVAIAAGCLDSAPEYFHVAKHIYAQDKGTYYEINDPVSVFANHAPPVST